jgi:hypothetical protein
MVYVANKLERLEAGSYFPRDTLLYSTVKQQKIRPNGRIATVERNRIGRGS